MKLYVCEDCDFEVKCKGCHSRCPSCGGLLKIVDFAQHKLKVAREKAEKDGNNNKA